MFPERPSASSVRSMRFREEGYGTLPPQLASSHSLLWGITARQSMVLSLELLEKNHPLTVFLPISSRRRHRGSCRRTRPKVEHQGRYNRVLSETA